MTSPVKKPWLSGAA